MAGPSAAQPQAAAAPAAQPDGRIMGSLRSARARLTGQPAPAEPAEPKMGVVSVLISLLAGVSGAQSKL